MITGQNGILNQATKAKEETEKASIEEKMSMAWSAVKSTEYINSNQNIDKSSYYLENLKKELALNGDVEDFNYVENGISTLKYKIKDENEYWYVKIPSLGKAIAGKTFGYQITSKNYGDKVEYSANGVDEWKILYCEGDKVFIISSDYVPNDKINVNNLGMTKNGMYSVYWDNVPDMQKTLQNKLFKAISYSLNNTYDNSKCVSTLLNTNNWNDFVNKYADYAIGGATVEMWMASWNEKYPDEKLYCNNTNEYGYFVGTENNPIDLFIRPQVLEKYIGYAKADTNNYLYFPHKESIDEDNCRSYWLASPNAKITGNQIVNISCWPYVDNSDYNTKTRAIRPVVCLKSDLIGEYVNDRWVLK